MLLIGVFYFLFVRFVKSIPDMEVPPELSFVNRKATFFQEYTKSNDWTNTIETLQKSLGISFKLLADLDNKNFFAISSNELTRTSLFTKNIQLPPPTLTTSLPPQSDNQPTPSTTSTATSTPTSTTTTSTATSTNFPTTTKVSTSSKSNAPKR
ncbi:MAG: hypothetical protein KatS3mg097_472 [Candidatus Parcubacteria bacterium]|nr:MAG: hypothetical protein KatS3mg097_472 [Candidatus Parcubacteria bacterium]